MCTCVTPLYRGHKKREQFCVQVEIRSKWLLYSVDPHCDKQSKCSSTHLIVPWVKYSNSALPWRNKTQHSQKRTNNQKKSYIISTGITGVWEHLIITNRKAKITELNVCVRARPLHTANKNTPATQNEWLPLSTWKKKSILHFCPSSRRRRTLKTSRTHIHSNAFTFIYEGPQSSWFCWVFQICNHYNNTSRSFLYLFVLLAVPLIHLHSKTQRSKFPGGLLVIQVVSMNDEYGPL